MNIEDVLAKLDPKTRKRLQLASSVEIEKQPTPSTGLNVALRGGLAYGRQHLVYGNKSAGKSSFLMQTIGDAQKAGKSAAWIDVEKTFDAGWASRLGADPDELIYTDVSNGTHVTNTVSDLLRAEVDIIVVDSVTSMLPSVYFEKDSEELKGLEGTKQIGSEARDLSNAMKMWNYSNKNSLLILVSQVRNKITPVYTKPEPTGGFGVRFYSTTVIKLWSSEAMGQAIEGSMHIGDRVFKQPIGREINWVVENNKTGPQFVSGKYDFYFGRDPVGVDRVGDLLDTAEAFGVVEKGGAWYTIEGERIQGRAKAVDYLYDNPLVFSVLVERVQSVVEI